MVEEVFGSEINVESRARTLRNLENGITRRPYPTTYLPICNFLGIKQARIQELLDGTPLPTPAQAQSPSPDFPVSDLERLKPWMETHTREVLEGLALRFGHDGPESIAADELKGFLVSKSQDLKKLEAQIANLPDPTGRIANVKGAALAAIENNDLGEAQSLIESALDIQRQEHTLAALRQDAELVEIQAQIALAQNDHVTAHAHYLAIAESFRPFDILEFAQRCFDYMKPLYLDALRYGGEGLRLGADLLKHTRDSGVESKAPELWGKIQNNLAIALREQGQRIGGQEGTDFLAEAVGACRVALSIRTETDHPLDWAMTQNNLAIALSDQGERMGGQEGTDLLAEAVEAYRAALRIYTETDRPVDWATTQNNLAIALSDQGERMGGQEGTDLLAEAVVAYRAALRIRTEIDRPVDWAMTQNNLAIALRNQGQRIGGQEGVDLLGDAEAACRAALCIRTEADHPMDWAQTQRNLARTLGAIADHEDTADPRTYLEEALDSVTKALTVYTPDHMPEAYQNAYELQQRMIARLEQMGEDG